MIQKIIITMKRKYNKQNSYNHGHFFFFLMNNGHFDDIESLNLR